MAFDTKLLEDEWNNGLVDHEIAEKLNCALSTVFHWRKKNGLPSNAGIRKWDNGGYADDKRNYQKGAKV